MDLAGRVGRTPGVLVATLAIATALGQTVHVGPGASEASFRVKEPYGIITLFRVTVPHGAVVKVEGRFGIRACLAVSAARPTCAFNARSGVPCLRERGASTSQRAAAPQEWSASNSSSVSRPRSRKRAAAAAASAARRAGDRAN